MGTSLHPPQLIVDARMLYLVWLPEDGDAVAKLVPDGLTPRDDRAVYINQYVVDDPVQTSNTKDPDGFGAYSLTYLGVDLQGLDADADTPGRFWTHYMNSSEPMRRYAAAHGVPASSGHTSLELEDQTLTATTYVDGTPVIRTTATVDASTTSRATGQLRYITKIGDGFTSGRYPYVANLADGFEVSAFEFLEPNHSSYQFRPADPLTVTFGFYSPAISFCYPGGEGPIRSADGN
ncbi:MAG: hypothetical protein ACT4PW_14215 [Acidimicrobiia bacterium]